MTVLYLPKELAGITDQTYYLETIDNNVTTPTDLIDLEIIDGYHTGGRFLFHIIRRTDTSEVVEMGEVFISKNSETGIWEASFDSKFGSSGVFFSVNQTSLFLQYQSTNISGVNYSGTITIGNKTYLKEAP